MICSPTTLAAPDPDDPSSTRIAPDDWRCLELLAEIGPEDGANHQAWAILLRVHGFAAVLRAVARCYWLVAPTGRVSSDQAQDVLDGKLPRALRGPRYGASGESRN